MSQSGLTQSALQATLPALAAGGCETCGPDTMPNEFRQQSLDVQGGSFVPTERHWSRAPQPDLTLIIPAYNEEARLPSTLRDLRLFLENWGVNYSVLVVSDGSVDKTTEIAEQFGHRFSTLALKKQQGKGAAVRAGMMNTPGRILAFTDADLPYDLAALQQGFNWINQGECDVVFGARDLKQSTDQAHRKISRIVASATFRWIVSQLVSRQVPDTQCGLKLFSRRAAKHIFSRLQIAGFAFDTEVVYRTQRLGLRFRKVPVTLINEHSSTLSLSRHAIPMLKDVVSMRWKAWWDESESLPLVVEDLESDWVEKRAA